MAPPKKTQAKKAKEDISESVDLDESNVDESGSGSESVSEEQPKQTKGKAVAKAAGRPKKAVADPHTDDEEDDVAPSPKKGGKKVAAAPAKKAGRPKKTAAKADDSEASLEASDAGESEEAPAPKAK